VGYHCYQLHTKFYSILLSSSNRYAGEIIVDHQCRFQCSRSTTDQISGICHILEKKWEYSLTLHQLFIGFKKAYDSVRREASYNILIEFRLPMQLVSLIKMCLNETYSKVHIGKHSSDNFHIQSGLKQGDVLSPLLFNFALEYAIRMAKESQVGLKSNGTHQLLAYTDDVNLLGDNIDTVNKNTETSIDASMEVGPENTTYMFLSCQQIAGQN
jgi:hypothetical protein